MDIEKLIPEFLREFEKRSKRERNYVSNNTLRTYQINLLRFVIFLKENNIKTNIKRIKEKDIIKFINHLVDKQLSPATRNQIISTLKSFFKWTMKNYVLGNNPVKEIKTAYQPRKEAKHFTDEDYNKFIVYLDKECGINQIIFRTLLQTGMRASELIQLNVEDVIFEKDKMLITVKKGKGNKKRIIPFKIVNKDGKENTENLKLYNLLKHRIRNRLKDETEDKIAVFISNKRKRITYQGLNAKFKSLMKKINLQDKGYSLHTFRHTFAMRLLRKKTRLKVVQTLLGHEDPVTTIRIYDHTTIKEIEEGNAF